MATKVKLTRPELKRYRDALARYERFLPMLKLKQQQLQMTLRQAAQACRKAEQERDEVDAKLRRYQSVLADRAGLPLHEWSRPSKVKVGKKNIAGVEIPVFQDAVFPEARYSLFGTPPWVDQTLLDLREKSRRQAAVDVLRQEEALLRGELTRIIQRVNLFEKVKIPDAREAIRKIRIKLGDEMTAGVGRSKIAKGKLSQTLTNEPSETSVPEEGSETA